MTNLQRIGLPYTVQTLTDLPASLRRPLQTSLKPDDPARLILVIPQHTQTRYRQRYVPQQALLFTAQGLWHVQEALLPNQEPSTTYLGSAELLCARHTLVLLYGCLELVGEGQGTVKNIRVEYSTASQNLWQAAWQRFLRQAYGPPPAPTSQPDRTLELLQVLGRQSFGFMNGLVHDALLPQEHLLGFVLQPRLVQRRLLWLTRRLAPATLLALTDSALLILEESRAIGPAYGWRVTFGPRPYWAGMTLDDLPYARRAVGIRLEKNALTLEERVILESEKAEAFQSLWMAQGS